VAEIVNLRMARKAKARTASAREADANRVRFGRTASEKHRDTVEAERLETRLRGALRDVSPEEGGGAQSS